MKPLKQGLSHVSVPIGQISVEMDWYPLISM